jgi:hypothetical protein
MHASQVGTLGQCTPLHAWHACATAIFLCPRGRGNYGILLRTGTAFIDGVGKIDVEVGEAMVGGVDSNDGTCD